jgi:hypothetical protein
MTRYFFRLRDGDMLLPDDGEGQEFKTMAAVRREAIDSARAILSEAALSGKAGNLDQQVEVMNEAGTTVLTVPVGHAVGTETQT